MEPARQRGMDGAWTYCKSLLLLWAVFKPAAFQVTQEMDRVGHLKSKNVSTLHQTGPPSVVFPFWSQEDSDTATYPSPWNRTHAPGNFAEHNVISVMGQCDILGKGEAIKTPENYLWTQAGEDWSFTRGDEDTGTDWGKTL
ncbi:uncharacterized protein LOC108593894 [Callithrix jacchus]